MWLANTTKNLRYKLGKDLNSKGKDVFEVTNPSKIGETRKTIARLKTILKGKANA